MHVARFPQRSRDRDRASNEVKQLAFNHVAKIDRKLAEMTAIRNTIAALAKQWCGDCRPECTILDKLDAISRRPVVQNG